MQLKIGEKIRSLRKNKNISQETLAQYLGVSFQAVSKWENNDTVPDTALIPAIASFFDVSIDALFDYDKIIIQEKIDEICKKAADLRDTHPEEAELILRNALKQFPGNEIILNNLLYTIRSSERKEEIIDLCKSIVECAKNDEVKYDVLRILAKTYSETQQFFAAEQTLEKIPELYFEKLELEAEYLRGEKSFKAALAQIKINIESTAIMFLIMYKRLREKGDYEDAEIYRQTAFSMLDSLAEIFKKGLNDKDKLYDYTQEVINYAHEYIED